MKIPILITVFLVFASCKNAAEKESKQIQTVVDSTRLKIETVEKHIENSKLASFLENPIDLFEFKATKGQSLSSVTNGLQYHFKPEFKDSIFYHYHTFPNDPLWKEISPVEIIVFKYGKNKHSWDDKTEILIEFTVSGQDNDLKKANLVGLTQTELESEFGTDFKIFDHRVVYSIKNKVLIVELENSKIKWFKYIKLNTENIDSTLIKKIPKSAVPHHR